MNIDLIFDNETLNCATSEEFSTNGIYEGITAIWPNKRPENTVFIKTDTEGVALESPISWGSFKIPYKELIIPFGIIKISASSGGDFLFIENQVIEIQKIHNLSKETYETDPEEWIKEENKDKVVNHIKEYITEKNHEIIIKTLDTFFYEYCTLCIILKNRWSICGDPNNKDVNCAINYF